MRLRSLELSDFRKFDRPVRLDGLSDGINVLAAPNEFGKSTLLAAIKAVLFERHRTRGQVGERMQHHRNATSPVLGLDFELAGGLHRIEKRFMHRDHYARLTLPDGTRIEGDAAEEKLQGLLGFAPPGRMGASADSVGLWGALWVAQREAVRQPVLPEAGRATLHACLEAELGTLSGEDRGGAIAGRVRAELSALLDGNGRPKGRFREAGERLAECEAELERLRDKRRAFEATILELARLRREAARASDPAAEAELASDVDDARRRREAAMRHSDVLRAAEAARELAGRDHAELAVETGARSARGEAIRAGERARTAAAAAEARARRERDDAVSAEASARGAVGIAEAEVERTGRALRTANAAMALVLRSDRLLHLADRLARATDAQAEVDRLEGAIAAHPATPERLRAVEKASAALDRARAVLDAQATEVELALEPGAAGRVRIDGSPAGEAVLRAVEDLSIEIDGIGRIRIRPAIRDRAGLLAAVASARTASAEALAAIAAADPAGAAHAAALRAGLQRRLDVAKAGAAEATRGDAALGLDPGLAALRSHVEAGRGRLASELENLELAALPGAAEAQTDLAAAEAAAGAAGDALARARTAHAGPAAGLGRAVAGHADANAELARADAELDRLRAAAAAAVAVRNDADLAAALGAAATALAETRATVARTERDAPADRVADMDARIARLEEARTHARGEVRRLREAIVRLEAEVAHDEADGLDERITEQEARRDAWAGEHAELRREAAVLALLRDTLAAAEREARERYVAPVLRRLTPYLQGLFPGVELGLGDALEITEVVRGGSPEAFERLSDGTMEQIAVLLRLAYADLLLERGRPAMLILDDALAYSDRDRLERIFDVLTRAAERLQILVLTCRADAFNRLGGARPTLRPA